ncbi:Plastocyanin domain-containing family protein [Heracleum sosnowskyi]|uniref:Plastocyanin domain-containing family protein n=1 Tax=Heracleum sosnowskyi TaxID=360622 RepID=A0AAD8MXN7_9APIA|nr:Plastocyanin domain-containing family protein [Heracleum sosnowskyi]
MALAAVCLVISLLAVPAAHAVDHFVGGSQGWNQGVNYATWASSEKFLVGDNLIFNYGSSHGVDEVSQSDYNSCTAGNALNTYTGGQNTVPLKKSGPMYFLCPSFGHCGGGMKLSITVAAASTPTATPPTSPESPSTPKDSPSGAIGGSGYIDKLVLGVCIVFAGLMGFMS